MEKPKYLTCALCHHFNSNENQCSLFKKDTFATNQEYADECNQRGAFMREMTVLCSASNFYKEGDHIPAAYIEDLSYLPKDKNNVPLFVLTKRGIERAVPAYPGIEMVSDHLLGVKREFTYQGQREIIYEYGVQMAKEICAALKIKLHVLPCEENAEGVESYKQHAKIYRKREGNSYGT